MSQTCGRKTGGSGSLHSSLSDVTYLFNVQEHARLGIRDFRHGHKEAHVKKPTWLLVAPASFQQPNRSFH
jgi:hypothetical protein